MSMCSRVRTSAVGSPAPHRQLRLQPCRPGPATQHAARRGAATPALGPGAAPAGGSGDASSSSDDGRPDAASFPLPSAARTIPWKLEWQVRGVEALSWSAVDRGSLVRAAARELSGWRDADFDARYGELLALVPDVAKLLPRLAPRDLLALLADTRATAGRLVLLKGELPATNVGVLLLLFPACLAWSEAQLRAHLAHARATLGSAAAAEEVLQWHPPLLDPVLLDGAMGELRRLVPQLVARAADGRELVHLLGIVVRGGAQGWLWEQQE